MGTAVITVDKSDQRVVTPSVDYSEKSEVMLSRVAEAIYWMSRYVERAENIARFMDVNFNLMLDLPVDKSFQWSPLVTIMADEEYFEQKYGEATQENVIQFLIFDRDYPSSVVRSLIAARENARSVREVISSEMWEYLNQFYWKVCSPNARQEAAYKPSEFFNEIRLRSNTFCGLMDTTMTHNESWHFGRMGRLLERADKTSRLLDVKYYILLPTLNDIGTPLDNIQWGALLNSASALHMYRKCHRRITPEQVVAFLLLNPSFPRSLHYCVNKAQESLHHITGAEIGTYTNLVERRVGKLRAELAFSEVKEIIQYGLHEYIDALQTKLNDIGGDIHEQFFALRPVPEKKAKSKDSGDGGSASQSQSQSAGESGGEQLQILNGHSN